MNVRYVKHKREKVGECTICCRVAALTYDHIPPQVAGNVNPVMLTSAMSVLSGKPQEDRPLLSQNGYKIRSICRDCNSTIGREYDPVIGHLCEDVNRYLKSPLNLPARAEFETVPSRLMRGILAHLLAAKLSPTEGVVDQKIREYLADPTAALSADLHLYYWLYPYPAISVMRDFGMIVESGRGQQRMFCSILKFSPLAFLLTDAPYFHGLPDLSALSYFGIDDPGRIYLEFRSVKPEVWPEGLEYSGMVLGGESLRNSIHGRPRKT
jgi:hypothetical protein